MSSRRVVVTGLGIISPIGLQVDSFWENTLVGKSGIRFINEFDVSAFSTKFAGLVDGLDIQQYMSAKEARKCDPFIQYGIAAGIQAAEHSGLMESKKLDLNKVGVLMGSGIGGLSTIESAEQLYQKTGPKRISPFFIPATIVNMIAGHLSIRYGFKGPNLAVSTACTTGTHCIGLASQLIRTGLADAMLAGGAEKASTPLGMGGFAAAKALSTRNEAPKKASRPWDKDRDGFVLGDGAGSLMLESYEHAMDRGATIYAELTGFGMSADAFHITRPSEGGEGARQAMQNALDDAKLSAESIQYINAHGTSTPAGDIEEIRAIKSILGAHVSKVAVSSSKSMIGHLLGAAGAAEAVATVLALRDQIAPPTINLDQPDDECDLNLVPYTPQKMKIVHAMSNSFGFGGTNGTLIFSKVG